MDILILLKACADETRIRLLNILINHELSVNEIVDMMGMGQSRISRHLKILLDAGLLKCRRDGVWAFYSGSTSGPGKFFIEAMLPMLSKDEALKKDLVTASAIIEERTKTARQFFNKIAGQWDRLKSEILGGFNLSKAIADLAPECDKAADLGCGTGDLLTALKSKAQKIIGVDSSSEMLKEARTRLESAGNEKADLRLGELEYLPLRDKEVSLAVSSMALHHIQNPVQAIKEAGRILEKDGTFIIAEYGKHSDESMRQKYGDLWLGFHTDEIKYWLEDAGFRLSGIETYELKNHIKINIYKSIKN
ncbi:ArsR/SmtB family transcription factor [Desulforegula conservatrix]|uniref:ArsR/SmtB family transcription factor n=1 Tax=Desulforegula conservatrix TaxID=153026 RepID=UPI0003F50E96|nr:metalloregulator ArsR/SmtB family transcription factor [Desulforegula conservatrix]